MTVVRSVASALVPPSNSTVGVAPKSPDTVTASDAEPDFASQTSTAEASVAGVVLVASGAADEHAVRAASSTAAETRGKLRRTRAFQTGMNHVTLPAASSVFPLRRLDAGPAPRSHRGARTAPCGSAGRSHGAGRRSPEP